MSCTGNDTASYEHAASGVNVYLHSNSGDAGDALGELRFAQPNTAGTINDKTIISGTRL